MITLKCERACMLEMKTAMNNVMNNLKMFVLRALCEVSFERAVMYCK